MKTASVSWEKRKSDALVKVSVTIPIPYDHFDDTQIIYQAAREIVNLFDGDQYILDEWERVHGIIKQYRG